jgi:Sigma-70, region 4.
MQLSEVIADKNTDIKNSVIDKMIEESKRTELWQIVKDNVTPEQNTVITARYRKNMTLEATGQLIGKPRDMARQIEANALKKLRLPRIRRLLQEKFEINYARAYRGSLTDFKNRWSSIIEDIAIRNIDELDYKKS